MNRYRLLTALGLLASAVITPAGDHDIELSFAKKNGKFHLTLKNRWRTIATTTYRWAYELKGWDAKGRLITNERAFLAKAELMAMRDSDWIVLKPGESRSFPVEFYNANGIVSGKVVSAFAIPLRIVSAPPAAIRNKKIPVGTAIRMSGPCRNPKTEPTT